MGLRTETPPDDDGGEDEAAAAAAAARKPTPQRRSSPPAAPVSRSGSGNGSRPNVVTLSSDEREMAKLMFPDSKNPEVDYAKNKLLLQREGKLNG